MSNEAMKLALEALEKADAVIYSEYCGTNCEELQICEPAIKALEEALSCNSSVAKQEQGEPVAWRNAAIRVGEDLCSVGPFGYYDMTAEQWLDWALSVVTVHLPPQQRTWVGLTDEELEPLCKEWRILFGSWTQEFAQAIEAKLKEKNT